MKVNSSIIRLVCLHVALVFGLLSFSGVVNGQTSTWDGSAWQPSGVAPSGSTGTYTFYVDAGTNCSIGDANMLALYVQNPSTICTISGTVTSTSVIIEYGTSSSDRPQLTVDGILNTSNLTIVGNLAGAGNLNLSAGTFSQTDGVHYGTINPIIQNFNVLSGSISFSYWVNFQNLSIANGASATITNYSSSRNPYVYGTLLIDGTFTNNYAFSDMEGPYYFVINHLLINNLGNYNGTNGHSQITQSFKIGGTLGRASNTYSYEYGFYNSSTSKVLEIFGNANIKFTDVANSNPSNKYIGTLNVRDGAKFTVDKSLTVNTLILNTGASLVTTGTPTLTASAIDPIDGRLILPGATLNYTPTSLTLNGTNSAIAYLNKPAMSVTLTGVTDTIRNCTLKQVSVNSGTKGYISNSVAGYKIQRLDVNDSVFIASLPKNDTINVSASGRVKLTGDTRVNRLVDIATGGSLISNGNLTMRDSSNLYFTTDGQISGNIKWHRKYGSNGWIFMGVPFLNLTRGSISTTGGASQQYIVIKKYVETRVSPRWVTVINSEDLGLGTGYIMGMSTLSSDDTLIFTGQPRLQPVTVSGLTFSSSNGAQYNYQMGYNLVANPFTAPINVSSFFTDNSSLNAIYLYDNLGQDKGVYVTRTSGGLFTPSISSVTAKNQFKIGASYLAPNQGFFIKIDSTNYTSTSSVTFNPSSVTKDFNNNFLKSAPVYLRLYTKNSSGTQNDIIFQFNDAVIGSINPGFDYSKLVSDTYPLEIYSLKKGNKLSIQTLKIDTSVHVPIGLIVKKNEKHSLWVSNFDALPAETDLYIQDKVANRSVNLRDSAFTVTLAAGTYDNRFEVTFKNTLSTETRQTTSNSGINETGSNVVIRTQYGQVFIDFNEEQKNVTVQVSDISGRVLYEKSLASAQGTLLIDSKFYLNKFYFIKILGAKLFKTSKLFIQ